MHIKVDEDLPAAVIVRLRTGGYQASTVVEQGMGGWKDPVLWQAIQVDGQFLITADKGFGNIRQYPPGEHGGVLVLRPDDDGIRPLLDLLERLLSQYDLNDLAGLLTVVTPRSVRIRRGES